MQSRREKHVRKLKKSHTWIWLIVFSILIVVSGILVAVLMSIYGSNFINEKLEAERNTTRNMADIYEYCEEAGNDPVAVLEAFNREYFIVDKRQKTVLYGDKGSCRIWDEQESKTKENTWSLSIISYIYDAYVYQDNGAPVIRQEENEVEVDFDGIFTNTAQYIVYNDRTAFTEEMFGRSVFLRYGPFSKGAKDRMLMVPLWIGVDMSDGEREFVTKCSVTMEVTEMLLMMAVVASIWLLVLTGYIAILINIMTGIVRRKKIMRVFYTDAVTQGNNYMYFINKGEERIRKLLNRNARFYAVSLRFAGYRNYCICHSLEDGERLIAEIYDCITEMLGKKEICAHASEADFALLLKEKGEDTCKERIRAIMDKVSHITEEQAFAFQAGVYVIEPAGKRFERRNMDLGEIYNLACAARESLNADDAGMSYFDEKLVEDRRWAEMIKERQQAALDNEEFAVYYQPKYDPRTDELCGAEALIRWYSPEFGTVSPGKMIPIFEKNGFITEIDHYMLKHVAKDQKRWLDAGYKCVPVSVNISRAHFIENDLAEQIRDVVNAEGTPHELIEIELTESAFFDDKKAMINTIEKLKSYGFAVSMDDFGSGYSSLNSLKDMPLDVLKLDAEFFRGDNSGRRGEIVVSEAIKLAKSLNMRTVAEGVEYREQVDFLASQGCDMIQGYFYAKPMPGEEYETRMSGPDKR